jgi:preprotein translocase subunit SecG
MILGFQIALILVSILLLVLVLLHRGRGGGLSDLFGGGVSTSLGGSSVAERNLDRFTVALALLWLALIVSLLLLTKA